MDESDAAGPRFIADCMLGRLAKWLRVLGYDAAYDSTIDDDTLIGRAHRERRVLLTRDTRLVARRTVGSHLLVESDRPPQQLVQVVGAFGLAVSPARILSRCLRCNEPTRAVPPEQVRDVVPPFVFETQQRFSRCPACGRVYWRATHVAGMLERLGIPRERPPG